MRVQVLNSVSSRAGFLAGMAALALLGAACGQKGPLTLPDRPAAAPVPAASAASAPRP